MLHVAPLRYFHRSITELDPNRHMCPPPPVLTEEKFIDVPPPSFRRVAECSSSGERALQIGSREKEREQVHISSFSGTTAGNDRYSDPKHLSEVHKVPIKMFNLVFDISAGGCSLPALDTIHQQYTPCFVDIKSYHTRRYPMTCIMFDLHKATRHTSSP